MSKPILNCDAAVVGGGPAGLIAALALAHAGTNAVLLAPRPSHADRRTTALLGASVDILRALGIWESIFGKAAPLERLRLADGTRRLIRTPEVTFDASEIGLEAFGYNIENETLLSVLREALGRYENLRVLERSAARVETTEERARLVLDDGAEIETQLVVAADGRNSLCRASAGIRTTKRALPQTALALNLCHTRPHKNTSTEFHIESGPFTLVPLPGLRSSLVWVCTTRDAERVRTASDAELAREIEAKSHSLLGEIALDGPRGIFPLGIEIAEKFAANRIALVGEAGHVIPPIGAQGLNLGIRDANAIAELVAVAVAEGRDPGGSDVMEAYDFTRRGDVRARAVAVEALGRSLLSGFLPVHMARGLGLEIASRVPFLRRGLMRGGLGGSLSARERSEIA
ncbi:MAG: UbiH/UbiF family hydroxylase [Xanthobacteraceae bacterium]|nr:UbiH/UbiF family hydroxylase [Xanthobacteraceae bacterium]